MKFTFKIIMFIFPLIVISQTIEKKIEQILEFQGTIKNYENEFSNLNYQNLTEKDSLALIEIEKKLTKKEITKRLTKSYLDFFSKKEINSIYEFTNSSDAKKLLKINGNLNRVLKNSFQDFYNQIDKIYKTEQYTIIDRENGFYETVNYVAGTYENDKLELAKSPCLTKNDITSVTNGFDSLGFNSIQIELTENGAKKLKEITLRNIQKPQVLVSNKNIIYAPIVTSEIAGGKLEISGRFTLEEANEIVKSLKKE